MALLGHHIRFLLPAQEPYDIWQNAGFDIQSAQLPVVVSDGQVVFEYSSDSASIKVCYHHASPEQLLPIFLKYGLVPTTSSNNVLEVQLLGGVLLRIEQHDNLSDEFPTREANSWLGFCDGLVIPTDNAVQTQRLFEDLGFFVLENTDVPFRRVDLTDGLLRVSVQETTIPMPTLLYACDVTPEAADELVHEVGSAYARITGTQSEVYYVSITTPYLRIVVVNDFDL